MFELLLLEETIFIGADGYEFDGEFINFYMMGDVFAFKDYIATVRQEEVIYIFKVKENVECL